jgi:hypothetical protein
MRVVAACNVTPRIHAQTIWYAITVNVEDAKQIAIANKTTNALLASAKKTSVTIS